MLETPESLHRQELPEPTRSGARGGRGCSFPVPCDLRSARRGGSASLFPRVEAPGALADGLAPRCSGFHGTGLTRLYIPGESPRKGKSDWTCTFRTTDTWG